MKKIVVLILGLLCFPAVVFADNWGVGVKMGIGENDPKTMQDIYDDSLADKKIEKNSGIFGLEAMYEWSLTETEKWGLRLGYESFGENELKINYVTVTENTYAIPLTAYYKKDNGIKQWSWLAGAGLSFIKTKMDIGVDKESKSKVFPHVLVGAEYRFSQLFALGVETKYNFSAKIKDDGEIFSDRSGMSGAITGRFYF